jgi:hypothetical protein
MTEVLRGFGSELGQTEERDKRCLGADRAWIHPESSTWLCCECLEGIEPVNIPYLPWPNIF